MNIMIFTRKNTIFEYTETSIKAALDEYIKNELGFDNRFNMSEATWNILSYKEQPLSAFIWLINDLCKSPADQIKKIITQYTEGYPVPNFIDGIEYSLALSGGYAEVAGFNTNKISSSGNITIIPTFDTLPVKQICNQAFKDCAKLATIKLPDSIIKIGSKAFSDCSRLSRVIFDNHTSLTIDEGAFVNCTNLVNFTIPNSVNRIQESTFQGCTELTTITIPSYITRIEENAFKNCNKLATVNFTGSESVWNQLLNTKTDKTGNDALLKVSNVNYHYSA